MALRDDGIEKHETSGAAQADPRAGFGEWLAERYAQKPEAERQADAAAHGAEVRRQAQEALETASKPYKQELDGIKEATGHAPLFQPAGSAPALINFTSDAPDIKQYVNELNAAAHTAGIQGEPFSLSREMGANVMVKADLLKAHPDLIEAIKDPGKYAEAHLQHAAPAAPAVETHTAAVPPPPPKPAHDEPQAAPHEPPVPAMRPPEPHQEGIGKRDHFHGVSEEETNKVRDAQQKLADLGIPIQPEGKHYGPKGDGVDGKLGDSTEKAIQQFQKDHGMEPTGRIDDAFTKKLDEAHKTHAGHAQAAPEQGAPAPAPHQGEAQVHGNPDLPLNIDPKVQQDLAAMLAGRAQARQEMAAAHVTTEHGAIEGQKAGTHVDTSNPFLPPVAVVIQEHGLKNAPYLKPGDEKMLQSAIAGLKESGVKVKDGHDGPATNANVARAAAGMDLG